MSVFVLWEDRASGAIASFGRNSVRHVVAVLDTDRVHDRFPGIPARRTVTDGEFPAWSGLVAAEIRKHAPVPAQRQLEICLLDRNLETLLALVGHGMPALPSSLRKDLLARDKILHRAAADPTLVHKACAQMPSWDHLVATVTRLVSATPDLTSLG